MCGEHRNMDAVTTWPALNPWVPVAQIESDIQAIESSVAGTETNTRTRVWNLLISAWRRLLWN